MSKSIESGHVNNVASFRRLIATSESFDGKYKPSKESLKISSLKLMQIDSEKINEEVDRLIPASKTASIALEEVFTRLSSLIPRVNNIFKSGNSKEVEEPVNALVKKLQGRRAKPKPEGEEKKKMEEEGRITKSASRMGKDSRTENFRQLIFLLEAGVYQPNEEELKLEELKKFLNELEEKNAALTAAALPLMNARIRRNEIMYKDETGLVDVAGDVKTYIKGAFGAGSPEYLSVAKLKFRRY